MLALLALLMAAPPVAGQPAFVVAATATLRAGPAPGSPPRAEVPIWTAVWVEHIEAGSARVIVGPRTLLFASPDAEPRPVAPAGRAAFPADALRGVVALADLDTEPASRRALFEQARRATVAGDVTSARALLARARALDPHDAEVASMTDEAPTAAAQAAPATPGGAPVQAALVYGCRGDLTRAAVVTGTVPALGALRPPPLPADACVARVDVRPPCEAMDSVDDTEDLDESDDGDEVDDLDDDLDDDCDDTDGVDGVDGVDAAPGVRPTAGPAAVASRQQATPTGTRASTPQRPDARMTLLSPPASPVARFKEELARFTPRFGGNGPAIRARVRGPLPRPLFVVTHLVVTRGCSGCAAEVGSTDVRVERLRVPASSALPPASPTVLHVMVPRYVGALYDIVEADSADDVEAEPFTAELGEAFDADPRHEDSPGLHLFVAPAACCACD